MVSVEELQKTIEWLRNTTNDNIIYINRDMKRELGNVINDLIKLNKIYKSRIDKAIENLFELKDMIYEPKTRKINFDIQREISTIIKILGDKE